MADAFSAKDTAHRLEVLAKDVTKSSSYDATHGCGVAESKLVQELKALHANPEHAKAVKSQMFWDNWKPNGLPTVELYNDKDHVTLNIETSISSMTMVESTGKIYGTDFPSNNDSAMQWTMKNFDALDKNKDGTLTYEEVQAGNPPAPDAVYLPNLGHVISSETTSGLGFGYSNSNYGSFGTASVGFHSTSNEEVIRGITKAELTAVYLRNRQLHCGDK